MIIELRGVDFVNKGAELMLHAVFKQIKDYNESVVICMHKSPRVPAEKLKHFDISIKLSSRKLNFIGKLIPRFFRRKLGIVLEDEINIVIDASGFAFGDQWGAEYAQRRLGNKIVEWKAKRKKIILLPQAFGPFSTEPIREVMKKIISNADLIVAREEESFDYLTGVQQSPHIIQSPDFTNLISGSVPSDFDPSKNEVAVIPNYKMIEEDVVGKDHYFGFLKFIIEKIRSKGFIPYFLIHEGKKDAELAYQLNKELENPLDVVIKDNALEIKGIISTARFVVCSRFHGVVSALSQGVPCMATSWSHKYRMLVKDYGFEEGLVEDLNDFEQAEKLLDKLADPIYNSQVSERLKILSAKQKDLSVQMWKKVFKIIQPQTTSVVQPMLSINQSTSLLLLLLNENFLTGLGEICI
ncbi:polysaccharide pyruvyl transferase family protein [Pedobacter sp. HMF7647]|uniref:Polysaccharide pyruvyl transferase family protein n=1 Tax=Hufsiella arboris TaxID=2695275 RepID=A0A7K1YD24_9SPHI|nr:polysaccharide pyruvyl transferase family protein [Hufsiella arboris]MXV52271.1 polysaccharide pyruvyl transferase family protein [Hufsiella arboris]